MCYFTHNVGNLKLSTPISSLFGMLRLIHDLHYLIFLLFVMKRSLHTRVLCQDKQNLPLQVLKGSSSWLKQVAHEKKGLRNTEGAI
jgi:hypothetical protein